MKFTLITLLTLLTSSLLATPAHKKETDANSFQNPVISLQSTSTWHDVSPESPRLAQQEKSICINLLDLKTKQATRLTKLQLAWKGPHLEKLSASLYVHENKDEAMIPIEKNFICDGIWDKKNQLFTFEPNHRVVAEQQLFIVLSFAPHLEKKVRSGNIEIDKTSSVKAEKID